MNAYDALQKHEGHDLAISMHQHQHVYTDDYFEVAELYCNNRECIDNETTSVLEFNARGEMIHADAQ